MRQDASSVPTLSPLPPYPSRSPPKLAGEQSVALPLSPVSLPSALVSQVSLPAVLSQPSPPPPPPPAVEPIMLERQPQHQPLYQPVPMRATHIHPRTAPASPERPSTAYSTRSTIRQVEPSPESLSDSLANGMAFDSTPALGGAFEPFPPFNAGQDANVPGGDDDDDDEEEEEDHGTHIPSTEPTVPALKRGGTPSGRTSPRKQLSARQDSRSRSPRKYMNQTPTLPAHQESPSSSYSSMDLHLEPPDTPSPVPREQQKHAYAPLQVRKAVASQSEGAVKSGPKTDGYGTQVRIADYMRQMKEQSGPSPKKVPDTATTLAAPALHIVQAMAQQPGATATLSPFSATKKQVEKEAARKNSLSRRSEASDASAKSKHSIFSTPGRDELERKKAIVEEDEGPFARATSMRDLEQSRRKVSGSDEDGEEGSRKSRLCGLRCVVM